ncbi:acyl-CoA thioester hydrolase [Inhella inkyongensis]|uniref:Acyl-CoA thioester hydrolase n=1 Tax=Inhella inkyongensis TaxID=392593 RepID=A0A840S5T8_9BURK|nr:acyl-CoA thioesterase [Inhella inkyongensis]MBB5205765.1 acyl-CoA thioester hydrolase [Inhella inkyongensis]
MPGREDPRLVHEVELTPAFHDLDPMDVVWHGRYVQYLEIARCALLQKFDYDYPQMRDSGYAWPVVDLQIKYVGAIEYGMKLRVRAAITEWENRLRIDYQIRDAATDKVITKAHTTQVAVRWESRELQFVCPPVLWERLGVTR